jgi:hypothetical protein
LLTGSLVVTAMFPCAIDTNLAFLPIHVPEKFDPVFLRGGLGIIPLTLSEKYKLIAWRYLTGLALNAEEQQALLPKPNAPYVDPSSGWPNARDPNHRTFVNTYKSSSLDKSAFYENCLPDAFLTAAKTLNNRREQYGNPALFEAWKTAQDQVFDNCSGPTQAYPDDPDPAMTPLARADRVYQIAAAHFYAEDLDAAEQRFRAIAADNNSPWHDTAAYMVVRTLIRESTLAHKEGALEQAKAELQKTAAPDLLALVDSLLDPSSALKSVAEKLAVPHPGAAIAATIDEGNYILTSDRFRKALETPGVPEPFDWIHTLESKNAGYTIQRWRETHSDLWLTAALILATNADPDLIEAGLKVPQTSPAFDTVTFHAIRLMIQSGQRDEARDRLNKLLTGKRRDLDSADNAFRGERMSLATGYNDFLQWAPRRPIGYEEDDFDPGPIDNSPTLDSDSVEVFNHFAPLPKLADAAESPALPAWPRTQLATSAWTRAFVLGDNDIANRVVPILAKAHPKWTADLESFHTAKGEAKRFAGAMLIARHADIQPYVWPSFPPKPGRDEFGPDWWCAEQPPQSQTAAPAGEVLSPTEQTEASKEVQRLHDSGSTQTFLAPIVVAWANTHPNDPRVPEALHRLVRITRYGCRGIEGNGRISKAAFDMLHKRYPASNWARETPYWFDK